MVRLCATQSCTMRPTFGASTAEKHSTFCEEHAPDGWVKLRGFNRRMRGRCSHQDCAKPASHGVAGCEIPRFCLRHAQKGMVNVWRKNCAREGCFTKPTYGVAGTKKAEFCSKHVPEGMVNVITKRCVEAGCTITPSYGIAGGKTASFCSRHARAEMVNVRSKSCVQQGCKVTASFGEEGSQTRRFCRQHASAGMTNKILSPSFSRRRKGSPMVGAPRGEGTTTEKSNPPPRSSGPAEDSPTQEETGEWTTEGKGACGIGNEIGSADAGHVVSADGGDGGGETTQSEYEEDDQDQEEDQEEDQDPVGIKTNAKPRSPRRGDETLVVAAENSLAMAEGRFDGEKKGTQQKESAHALVSSLNTAEATVDINAPDASRPDVEVSPAEDAADGERERGPFLPAAKARSDSQGSFADTIEATTPEDEWVPGGRCTDSSSPTRPPSSLRGSVRDKVKSTGLDAPHGCARGKRYRESGDGHEINAADALGARRIKAPGPEAATCFSRRHQECA